MPVADPARQRLDPEALLAAADIQDQRATELLLTVKEYADLRRVHVETVKRWIKQGLIEAERTAGARGHWRIKRRRDAA
jgi:excisionase family DNA binding protein